MRLTIKDKKFLQLESFGMLTHLLRLLLTKSFRPFIFSKKNNQHTLDLNVENLGIYFHIPFCKSICSFCPYNKILYDPELVKDYKQALLKEVDLVGKTLTNKPKTAVSLYYGGGSPALMVDDLIEINSKINEYFFVSGNSGIELHPENIDESTLEKIKSAGFDMISIGVQSFRVKPLNSLGRKYIDSKKVISLAQNYDFKAIDVDLIFGFKGQTTEDLINDFTDAVESGATQISTYPFIDFSFSKNKTSALSAHQRKQMLQKLDEMSQSLGFEKTSIWTFSRKNTPQYSSITRDNFIGFGPGATTLLKDIFKINTFSVEEFIKAIQEEIIPTALTLNFSERTRSLYWLFWSCYNMSILQNNHKLHFDKDLTDLFGDELKLATLLNLLIKDKTGYKVTSKGAYYFHLVEQVYTHQYISKTWEIMLKNPWPEEIILY